MGNENHKPTTDTHAKKKKQLKHNTKGVHQTTRQKEKRGKEEKDIYKNKLKIIKKCQQEHTSIITLNENGLTASTKRHRLADWIQKQGGLHTVYILSRDYLVTQLCPTLCDPIDCSLPSSSVHWMIQTRMLEGLSISFSRGLQKTHFTSRDTYRPKVREWKKIFHINESQKKTRIIILISDKIYFNKDCYKSQARTLQNDQ